MIPNPQNAEEVLVTLPNIEKMSDQLNTVEITDHIKQKLFPRLLKEAGRVVTPEAVVLLITLAIYDSCKGLPPMIESITIQFIPQLITALITDEKALAQAMELYNSSK